MCLYSEARELESLNYLNSRLTLGEKSPIIMFEGSQVRRIFSYSEGGQPPTNLMKLTLLYRAIFSLRLLI